MMEEAETIPLWSKEGNVVAVAIIDRSDSSLASHRWHRTHYGYAARTLWIPRTELTPPRKGLIWLHREVLGLARGIGKPQVDHINGDRLDCRKSNLRTVAQVVNLRNRGSLRGSSSRYVGVSWYKAYRKWAATVVQDGKSHFLGYYDDEDRAGAVVEAKMRELRGPEWNHREAVEL